MNKERVRKMCRLAMYGQIDGKRDLNTVRYYRSDYVGLGVLLNFLLITIGYAICLLAFFVYNVDFIISYFYRIDATLLITGIIVIYIFLVGLYSVLVFTRRRLRFSHAQENVLDYYNDLCELCDEYEDEFYGTEEEGGAV